MNTLYTHQLLIYKVTILPLKIVTGQKKYRDAFFISCTRNYFLFKFIEKFHCTKGLKSIVGNYNMTKIIDWMPKKIKKPFYNRSVSNRAEAGLLFGLFTTMHIRFVFSTKQFK